jgi:hypothetical protein
MSSIEYPVRVSSGKTASATPSSAQSRAASRTAVALAAGSAIVVFRVQAATRRNPCW